MRPPVKVSIQGHTPGPNDGVKISASARGLLLRSPTGSSHPPQNHRTV